MGGFFSAQSSFWNFLLFIGYIITGDILEFFIIILAAVIVVFLGVLFYYFNIAFVKMDKGNLADLDHIENAILADYREIVQGGMDYINNQPHEWVETKSFDGLKLMGRYYDNNCDKTMLLFHGYRSLSARDFSCAVKMYSDMGFNVLLVDQRAHGKSQGKLITFGVKESRDVLSWVNFLNKNYGEKNLALGGMSMGATTVLLAAGLDLPKNVKCIVADCGFTSPKEIIKLVAKRNFKVNADYFLPFLNLYCLIFGHFSILKASTVDSVKKSNLPILFIHGKNDGFVPCDMSQTAYDAIKERAEIVLIDEADHGMAFLVDTKTVHSKLEDFLKRNTA